jgi:DnaK suppressor protein
MNALGTNDFKDRLLHELAAATAAVQRDRIGSQDVEAISASPDEGDLASMSHDRTIHCTLTEARSLRLRAIEEALQRIDSGEYGLCQRCEESISAKRLAAVPWANLCLACQEDSENAATVDVADIRSRLEREASNDLLCA